MKSYEKFLASKRNEGANHGFQPVFMPDGLFDFQKHLVDWSLRKGRGALFEDCGLGKTYQFLVWAENVHRHTNKPVLILAPLAVSAQIVREANKFDMEITRSYDDGVIGKGVTVTNYEQLHRFSSGNLAGVVCDESSILKSFDGTRRKAITSFMRKIPYRLLATATAAPNDYTELGTSSEALGYMGHMDMLNRFFKNDMNNSSTKRMYGEAAKWRFKGYAEIPFWRWVTSWAKAIRKPSDIGYENKGFDLPPLNIKNHLIDFEYIPNGELFSYPAMTLRTQREESKRSITERCEKVAELVSGTGNPALIWCHRNEEGDLLESLIDGSVQVAGKHSDAV
ncbi:MAG: helicase, partial [Gammaproteobacteria bacterium]|nr:helicase [Gammaproteobacteria bacterium]